MKFIKTALPTAIIAAGFSSLVISSNMLVAAAEGDWSSWDDDAWTDDKWTDNTWGEWTISKSAKENGGSAKSAKSGGDWGEWSGSKSAKSGDASAKSAKSDWNGKPEAECVVVKDDVNENACCDDKDCSGGNVCSIIPGFTNACVPPVAAGIEGPQAATKPNAEDLKASIMEIVVQALDESKFDISALFASLQSQNAGVQAPPATANPHGGWGSHGHAESHGKWDGEAPANSPNSSKSKTSKSKSGKWVRTCDWTGTGVPSGPAPIPCKNGTSYDDNLCPGEIFTSGDGYCAQPGDVLNPETRAKDGFCVICDISGPDDCCDSGGCTDEATCDWDKNNQKFSCAIECVTDGQCPGEIGNSNTGYCAEEDDVLDPPTRANQGFCVICTYPEVGGDGCCRDSECGGNDSCIWSTANQRFVCN